MKSKHLTLALTGASGMPYGLRLLAYLLRDGQAVDLLVSSAARVVLQMETDLKLPSSNALAGDYLSQQFGSEPALLRLYGQNEWSAPMASGSAVPRAMVVCPCTSGTLAAIACGNSDTLMERAADVVIKEGRKLILVHREMPLSAIHLEHMLKLARLGVCIMPASPGFYHRPDDLSSLVDFVVARILDQLDIEHDLCPPWGGERPEDAGPA